MSSHRFINSHISTSKSLNRKTRISNVLDMSTPIIILVYLTVNIQMSWAPTIFTTACMLLFFIIVAFGLAVGYHRFFAHHAFKTSKVGKIVLGVLGAWALQGSVTSWVADHRRHHRFSDMQYDPHSPYANDQGLIKHRMLGWLHAHVGWMITVSKSDENRYASDCVNDPALIFLSRYYRSLANVGFVLPGIFGWLYNGLNEALLCFFWASCVRSIVIHQLAWSANSFGHMFGDKIEGALDESRNNVLLGVILLGEGLHSYHHQYPTLAMNEPAKFDVFGHSLVFFERLGLVWDLRKGKPVVLQATSAAEAGSQSTATI